MAINDSTTVEAAILCCGYNIGFFNKSDIEHWAEAQIAAVDKPSDVLIELAILRDIHPLDVMKLLKSLCSSFPTVEWLGVQIGFIGICFDEGKITLSATVRGLYALARENGISPDQESTIYWLDDAYDLAIAGTYGKMEQVEAEARAFVLPYAESLRNRHSLLMGKSL